MHTQETPYAGIDYSLGRSNRDPETGVRYGVISCNSVNPDALNEIMQDGQDLAYEEAIEEAEREWNEAQAELPEDEREEFDAQNWSDGYCSDGGLSDYLYEQDGYKLTGCLDNDLFVLRSPYFTYAQFCSPCVPGAGNLDSPYPIDPDGPEPFTPANHGFPPVYCLGHDWFEGGKAPYPVFSVETNERVNP